MDKQTLINRINKVPDGKEIKGMVTCDGDVALYYETGNPYPDEIEIIMSLEAMMQ